MNGAGKGIKSCRGERDLLLLLLFMEKQSERLNLELDIEYGLGHRIIMKRSDDAFITGCVENIVREGDTIEILRLNGMFHVSET